MPSNDAYRTEIAKLRNENKALREQLEKKKGDRPEKGYMDREARAKEEK